MTTTPPPSGTIIEIVQRSDATVYSWPATERHPLQKILMLFGGVMVAQAFLFIAIIAFDDQFQSPPWVAGLAFLVFGGMGSVLFWCGYRKRGRETLELSAGSLMFDNGPTILPWPFLWFVGFPFQMHPFFSNMSAKPEPHFRRKIRTILRDALGPVVLERVGERQRLRVDDGRDRVEIGAWLSEPEREWLATVVSQWQGR